MRSIHRLVAVTVAALLSGAVRSPGRTAAVLSGGNVDPTILMELAAPT